MPVGETVGPYAQALIIIVAGIFIGYLLWFKLKEMREKKSK